MAYQWRNEEESNVMANVMYGVNLISVSINNSNNGVNENGVARRIIQWRNGVMAKMAKMAIMANQ
jgi:hypothetical protein